MWKKADTPRSNAEGSLQHGGEVTTMNKHLATMRSVIPIFVNLVPDEQNVAKSKPNPLDLQIGDIKEKAYQRAFFLQKRVRVQGAAHGDVCVDWLDIEVPVIEGDKPRRPSLDMIGFVDGMSHLIAELKGPEGESPFHAIQELLSYACCARDNHARLVSHPSWKNGKEHGQIPNYWPEYKGKYLVVSGPREYWNKWRDQLALIAAAGSSWLIDSGLRGHRLILAEFDDENFAAQRMAESKYAPQVKSNIWSVLYEAYNPS